MQISAVCPTCNHSIVIQTPTRLSARAMAVHSELGCGYLEAVYKAAMRSELRRRSIEFRKEVPLPIDDKGERLPMNYRVDVVCTQVLVEVKALSALAPVAAVGRRYEARTRIERVLACQPYSLEFVSALRSKGATCFTRRPRTSSCSQPRLDQSA